MRVPWLLLALSLTVLPAHGAHHALVIGNSNYPGRLYLGANPRNDANAIGDALAGVGFQIEPLFDVRTQTQFKTAVNRFARTLNARDEVVLYYSGHGLQVRGKNYLVPTQALIATEAQVPEEAVSVDFVLAALTRAGTGVVIIDACRDNPYKGLFKGDPPIGLKAQNAPAGFLLAFAADEGQRAASGAGEANSPYIKQLQPLIGQPGLSVFDVFTQVRSALDQETGGTQQPMFSSRLNRTYCFAGCGRSIVPQDPAAVEQALELRRDERTGIQVALNTLGHPVGEADGIWGSNTRAGIQAWQRATGRTATGYLSGEAYKVLLAQAPAPRPEPPPVVTPITPPPVTPAGPTPIPAQGLDPELVGLPGGCFQMGSPASEQGRDDDERQHHVCVKAFAIGTYEVTNKEFRRFRPGHDSGSYGGDDQPAVNVSWNDAVAYAEWLSQRTGMTYRLPTEAEWEYAARGGTSTRYWWGDQKPVCRKGARNGAKFNDNEKCNDPGTEPVGSYQANPYGLYDTSGNVWEWTCSAWANPYDGSERGCQMTGDAFRVGRGGGWYGGPRSLRAANRLRSSPGVRGYDLGFRLARTL